MGRFSPEFVAKLRRKIGNQAEFAEAYLSYLSWRHSFRPEVISPFCARYVGPFRVDGGERPSEVYDDPPWFILPPARNTVRSVDEEAPPLTPSQESYLEELACRSPFLIREARIREERARGFRLFFDRMARRIVQLERQYIEISQTIAQNAMRDPLNHPTAEERQIVNYLREKLESEREKLSLQQQRQRGS